MAEFIVGLQIFIKGSEVTTVVHKYTAFFVVEEEEEVSVGRSVIVLIFIK